MGGIIGVVFFVIGLIIFPFTPLAIIIYLTGFNIVFALFKLDIIQAMYIAIVLFIIFGAAIGYFIDKKVPRKNKIILLIILLIIFAPISAYTHYTKFTDKKIMVENKIGASWKYPKGGRWNASDPEVCEQLSILVHWSNRIDCFTSAAIINQNISICKIFMERGLTDSDYHEGLCMSRIGIDKKDPEICRAISSRMSRNGCFLGVAKEMEDPLLCLEVKYPARYKDDCYYGIAKTTKNTSLCENIADSAREGECYSFGDV